MKRLFLGLLCCIALSSMAADVRVFGRDSRATIEHAHAGKPFVLVFWSVDCAYCVDELKQFETMTLAYPDIALVLVGTDGPGLMKQADDLQARNAPHLRSERWMFDDTDPDRLYFSVDKQWHGELPRAYFYDADGHVRVVAGQVEAQWIKRWMSSLGMQEAAIKAR
jgi:hypothetical protein